MHGETGMACIAVFLLHLDVEIGEYDRYLEGVACGLAYINVIYNAI